MEAIDEKKLVLQEMDDLPSQFLREVLHFVQFLKTQATQESMETALLSESALRKDWLRPEEDEAWRDL